MAVYAQEMGKATGQDASLLAADAEENWNPTTLEITRLNAPATWIERVATAAALHDALNTQAWYAYCKTRQ